MNGALRLLEDAGLTVATAGRLWLVADSDGVLGTGATLDAAVAEALPVAVGLGHLDAADVEALDADDDDGGICWGCAGTGEGSRPEYNCGHCGGSGRERSPEAA